MSPAKWGHEGQLSPLVPAPYKESSGISFQLSSPSGVIRAVVNPPSSCVTARMEHCNQGSSPSLGVQGFDWGLVT